MREDNRGLTLVELIIAISMSTIIIGAAAMFLYNAERSYRVAEQTIDLQMEAQILMEQISNWVMESNKIIVSGGDTLILYSVPRLNGEDSSMTYPAGYVPAKTNKADRRVIWVSNGKLYMTYTQNIDKAKDDISSVGSGHVSSDEVEENCIGEFVSVVNFIYSSSAPNKVGVTLTMKEGKQSYVVSDEFSLRNKVFETSSVNLYQILRKVVIFNA